MSILEKLEVNDWLKMNSQLQQKKNSLRKDLNSKGVLQKGAKNDFDHYKYFSEAQYKELFTELFSKNNLELKFEEIAYDAFEGNGKQPNGRMARLIFYLIDVETGFYETTMITGEAIDKGDKAGYKAYTGALKYYLADTFMVATGDDPEKDSPDVTTNTKKENPTTPMTPETKTAIDELDDKLKSWLLKKFKIEELSQLSQEQATWFITEMKKKAGTDNGTNQG